MSRYGSIPERTTTITPISLKKPVTMRQSRWKKLQGEFVSLKMITQVMLIYI